MKKLLWDNFFIELPKDFLTFGFLSDKHRVLARVLCKFEGEKQCCVTSTSMAFGNYFVQKIDNVVFCSSSAAIAQLGERQTEDLEVPSSILGHGNFSWGCYSPLLKRKLLFEVAQCTFACKDRQRKG